MRSYRGWFLAAAAYNLLWGTAACLFPTAFLRLGNLEARSAPLFQAIGMIVGVYAYAYWLLSRDPIRYCGLVWTGLIGKLLGPVGFLFAVFRGELPWTFGWINVTNDLIWLPAFALFAWNYARRPLEAGAI